MNARQGPGPSGEDDASDGVSSADDAFAGLTPIDVVDGELVPRGRRR